MAARLAFLRAPSVLPDISPSGGEIGSFNASRNSAAYRLAKSRAAGQSPHLRGRCPAGQRGATRARAGNCPRPSVIPQRFQEFAHHFCVERARGGAAARLRNGCSRRRYRHDLGGRTGRFGCLDAFFLATRVASSALRLASSSAFCFSASAARRFSLSAAAFAASSACRASSALAAASSFRRCCSASARRLASAASSASTSALR